jgi:multidrug transporter EmrE-like cation transporter
MAVPLLLLLLAIGLGAVAQICLKLGVRQLGEHPPALQVLASIVSNRWVFLGFFSYGASSLFYIVAISRLDVSYAYPMIALGYVIVAFCAGGASVCVW